MYFSIQKLRCLTFTVFFKYIYNFSHGFVPNGGRVYYLIRSQPPVFTSMVYEYFLSTGDLDYVLVFFKFILKMIVFVIWF